MGGIQDVEREIEASERRTAALRKLVEVAREVGEDGVVELLSLFAQNGNGNGNGSNGDSAEATGANHTAHSPRGREAIRVIVGERPGIWTLAQIRDEMQRRGWLTSGKAVETAISRLCAKREGRRIGKGRYVFPPNYGEEDTVASDASGVALIAPIT